MCDKFLISRGDRLILIEEDSILYMEADGAYTLFYMVNGLCYRTAKNLKHSFEKIVQKEQFIKTHRSYLVNIKHLNQLNKTDKTHWMVLLPTGNRIPVSLSHLKELKNKMRSTGNSQKTGSYVHP
jgi:two-component system LytT family response regulator